MYQFIHVDLVQIRSTVDPYEVGGGGVQHLYRLIVVRQDRNVGVVPGGRYVGVVPGGM